MVFIFLFFFDAYCEMPFAVDARGTYRGLPHPEREGWSGSADEVGKQGES
jgi:hypothetical protein